MKNTPSLFEKLSSLMVDGMTCDYKSVIKKSMIYYENRRQDGFKEFTTHLLNKTATKNKLEYEKMFKSTEDQYYALLSATVEDEEKEKAHIYANVYNSILNENIKKERYSRIIRVAKNLPYSAIQLLPIIYIYMNFHTMYKSLSVYLNELYQKMRYELNILDQYDIIKLPSGELQFSDSAVKINEKYFYEIIKVFFMKEDLSPKKFHIPLWDKKKALIITNKNFINSNNINEIETILKDIRVSSEQHSDILSLKENFSHYIFLVDGVENIGISIEEAKKMHTNNKIIKVSFNYVPRTTDVLILNDEDDIQKFKKQFSE